MTRALLFASVLLSSSSASAEPLIVDNRRLFIQPRINGVATEALLDSCAESSLFDPKLATEAHFGPGEKVRMKGPLKYFIVTADFKGRKAWFEPVAGDHH